jgi:hypothetical protein
VSFMALPLSGETFGHWLWLDGNLERLREVWDMGAPDFECHCQWAGGSDCGLRLWSFSLCAL